MLSIDKLQNRENGFIFVKKINGQVYRYTEDQVCSCAEGPSGFIFIIYYIVGILC